jgi:hypothetical protein
MNSKLLAALLGIIILSGCASTVPQYPTLPPVKVITETVEVEIYAPPLPNAISLSDVEWKVITNTPCKPATGKHKQGWYTSSKYATEEYTKEDGSTGTRTVRDDEGNRIELEQLTDRNGDPIEVCGNLQQKIIEIEKELDSAFVVMALTPDGYEAMAANLQEIKRYIAQQKDIIYYYREATAPKGADGWLEENKERQQNQLDAAAADNEQPAQPQPQPESTGSSILNLFRPKND